MFKSSVKIVGDCYLEEHKFEWQTQNLLIKTINRQWSLQSKLICHEGKFYEVKADSEITAINWTEIKIENIKLEKQLDCKLSTIETAHVK